LPEGAWPNFTLSNHDQPRHAFRYRGRDARTTEARARIAAAMLLTLRGTPFLYYGEEIGMGCERLPRAALRDPLGIATWPLGFLGRDPERTPMQWDGSPGAGFVADPPAGGDRAAPWLPPNSDYVSRNVSAQLAVPGSLLSWYKALLALRRGSAALREGSIAFLDLHEDVLAYERRSGGERVLVLLNFSSRPRSVGLGSGGRVLLGSAAGDGGRGPGAAIAAGELELTGGEALVAALS